MIIETTAPTRVDLAGGTIDIWPLYLFHPGASTVNFAISLAARCRIETRDDNHIILESRDRQLTFETSVGEVENLVREERLELISKLVHFFKPETGFHLVAESTAPAGAGLGGSSALTIACIGALNKLVGDRYDPRRFIIIAANVETTVIRVPAGFQDYYAAFHGGLSAIHFNANGIRHEALEIDAAALEERIVICYTGEPRLSGINNWEMTKTHIDGDKTIFDLFENIRDSARNMRVALIEGDWRGVSDVMQRAYPNRKRLAPNITTPHMEMLVEKAIRAGAEAAKVCGAGGGGCIAFLCAEGAKESVTRALATEEGAQVLQWKFAREGLTVSTS
ncbi:MAG: GHMP kinase [Pyrinomonadaceae bacterium]|nr:GHMP kinase [Pyrinomonadaceae bacterium]